MKLGELISSKRKTADLSLQDVANSVGISKQHVWEIEQSKTINLGFLLAIRLSIALAIPINLLASSTLESYDSLSKLDSTKINNQNKIEEDINKNPTKIPNIFDKRK